MCDDPTQSLMSIVRAHEGATQLQVALHAVLSSTPEAHPSWLDVARDIQVIARRLEHTMLEMQEVLGRDPRTSPLHQV